MVSRVVKGGLLLDFLCLSFYWEGPIGSAWLSTGRDFLAKNGPEAGVGCWLGDSAYMAHWRELAMLYGPILVLLRAGLALV
jgi:hypothetical protein